MSCDGPLISAAADDALKAREADFLNTRITLLAEAQGLRQIQDVLGSYFRIRSFAFMYSFCRHQIRFGEKFERFFVEPVSFLALIKIPWMVINMLDSLVVRLTYQGYCRECQWKYKRLSGSGGHSQ